MILIIGGNPGAGKSTVGKLLAKKLGYFLYDVDDHISQSLKEKMRGGEPVTDQDRDEYLQEAVNLLKDKKNAILVTPLYLNRHRKFLLNSLKGSILFWLDAPYEVMYRRTKDRKHFVNPSIFKQLYDHNEPVECDYILIDATKEVEDVVKEILHKIP